VTKASRVPVIGVLLIGVLYPPAPVSAQERPAIADQIAKTYGLDSFGQIDAIRYTFNIDLAALKLKLSRSWVWEPKTDQISYEGKDKAGNPVKVTYSRSQLASQSAVVKDEVDPGFFNDQYWLLFPFHLVWDTSATVQDAGMQKLPLGKGSARKVAVKYPSGGGYTPAPTGESGSSSFTTGEPRSRVSSLRPGLTTRRLGRCSSHWITAERPTASRSAFSSRMWPSNWWGQAPG